MKQKAFQEYEKAFKAIRKVNLTPSHAYILNLHSYIQAPSVILSLLALNPNPDLNPNSTETKPAEPRAPPHLHATSKPQAQVP